MREGRKAFGAEAENTNREIKAAMFLWVLPTHQKVNYRTSFSVKIANQNCSASCELIRNIFNCHSCSLQISEPKWTAAALPGCLWPCLVTRRRKPSRLCTASITNVLCSLWNYPLHSFKRWNFCLTNAIFNYTESSILLWSNGVYYSSKWHQSATIFPRANYSTLLSFRRSSGLHVRRYTAGAITSCQSAPNGRKCHQETLIVMACNGLLTASLTMVTNGAVASRQVLHTGPSGPTACYAQVVWRDGADALESQHFQVLQHARRLARAPTSVTAQCSHYTESYIKANKCTADDLARGALPLA